MIFNSNDYFATGSEITKGAVSGVVRPIPALIGSGMGQQDNLEMWIDSKECWIFESIDSQKTILNYSPTEIDTTENYSKEKQLNALLPTLLKRVQMPKVYEVKQFLLKIDEDPDQIIDIIIDHVITALKYGPAQSQIYLELYSDIEEEDEFIALFIRQEKYDEEIMRKIELIREKLTEKGERRNWIFITTDFQ